MFASLDRADIELKAGPDGRRRFVQTDHRAAAEIDRTPHLSVVFALVRVLNPKREADDGRPVPVVFTSFPSDPPEYLCQSIRAADGLVVVGDKVLAPPDGTPAPPLEAVIEAAFGGLALTVAAEFGVPLGAAGVAEVEAALAASAGSPEEDELRYWSAVVKLGAFAGEVIRAANGGAWAVVRTGTVPFALKTRFRGEEATANVFGKAVKRFARGESDSVSALVTLIQGEP